jgi:cytochrome c oxidase assembly protein subunit 15
MTENSFTTVTSTIGMRAFALSLVNCAVVLVLLVVLMGGWTRINDAGLSCPDWPGCFGQMTVPNTAAQIDSAAQLFPEIEVVQAKSWLEMIHRYLAGTLGLLILALAVIAIYLKDGRNYPYILSFSLLALVVFQALLGMWTVTLKLLPIVVTAHLFGGLLTTVLLLLLRDKIISTSSKMKRWNSANYTVFIGLILLFMQILLGGWTSSNYAAWGCSDWLGCNPNLDIDYDFYSAFTVGFDSTYSHEGGTLALEERGAIQITHRIGAMIVAGYFIWMYFAMARHHLWAKACLWLVYLTIAQIILGLMNIALAVPSVLAMAHHLLAVIMLIQTTRVLAISFSSLKGDVQ